MRKEKQRWIFEEEEEEEERREENPIKQTTLEDLPFTSMVLYFSGYLIEAKKKWLSVNQNVKKHGTSTTDNNNNNNNKWGL